MKNQNRRILTRKVATPLRTEALKAVAGGRFGGDIEIYTVTNGELDACDQP
jgi:hypothetical protein